MGSQDANDAVGTCMEPESYVRIQSQGPNVTAS